MALCAFIKKILVGKGGEKYIRILNENRRLQNWIYFIVLQIYLKPFIEHQLFAEHYTGIRNKMENEKNVDPLS